MSTTHVALQDSTDQIRLKRYARVGRNTVDGWFSRIDAEIYRAILLLQNAQAYGGAIAEVGVYKGKSFVASALALKPGEHGYCIDLFDAQEANLDRSGGFVHRTEFENNLRRFGVRDVIIRESSSDKVRADEILRAVGPVRFFSVDGGHWQSIVVNDLALAEKTLADYGVIALDDFHRPEWPDVSAGFFKWYSERQPDLVPFAIGFNKLYLCHKAYLQIYQDAVVTDDFLKHFIVWNAKLLGQELPVLNELPLPEWNRRQRFLGYLRNFHPDFFVSLAKSGFKAR